LSFEEIRRRLATSRPHAATHLAKSAKAGITMLKLLQCRERGEPLDSVTGAARRRGLSIHVRKRTRVRLTHLKS
jgi:hypothetical protein